MYLRDCGSHPAARISSRFRAANPSGGGIAVVADAAAPMGAIIGAADEIRLGGIDDITFTTTVTPVPQ